MWQNESLYKDYRQSFLVKKVLYTGKSKYQKIKVIETALHGRVLLLDGIVQLTEKDEPIYHEMMVHVPMNSHPKPKHVLIIGGGDGGILRRVLEHDVESVTMVEIDELVVKVSRKHLPKISADAFMDKRVKLVIADAYEYVKNCSENFDVIITDRGDDIGPGNPLFTDSFYAHCHKRLTKQGVFVSISGIPSLQNKAVQNTYQSIKSLTKHSGLYLINCPMYTGGPMAVIWGSDSLQLDKIRTTQLTKKTSHLKTNYYNPAMHEAAFAIPNDIKKLITK